MIDSWSPTLTHAERVAFGRATEERVAEAIVPERMPWWFLGTRPSTPDEDRAGIDRVVYTRHVGRILLQVKSSRAGRVKFDEHLRRWGASHRIHVVVARPDMDLATVLGRVLAACVIAIEEAEAARMLADDVRLCRLEAA